MFRCCQNGLYLSDTALQKQLFTTPLTHAVAALELLMTFDSEVLINRLLFRLHAPLLFHHLTAAISVDSLYSNQEKGKS